MPVLFRACVITILMGVMGDAAHGGEPVAASRPPIGISGRAFGTTYSVKVAFPATIMDAGDLQNRIEGLLAEIDSQMSLWREDSELSLFNRHRGEDWFDVSAPTARVVAAAVELSRATHGAFDPTVFPLVQLWGFGPGQQPLHTPAEEEIAQARKHVGVSLIDVRRSPPALRKLDPTVQLDLNAIAKGDAVDRVATLLDRFNPLGYMVEIGGEVRTHGTKADGSPWSIGIEQPTIGKRIVQSAVELNDAALATSGDYRNFIEADGQRFSHTIDPRTGRPINHTLAAVSVVADDCMTADAWATALMVLGPVEGHLLAEARGIRALFLTREGEQFSAQTTSGFPRTRQLSEAPGSPDPPGGSSFSTFVLTVIIFGIAMTGMSVGVILYQRRLRGSCGGLSGLKDEHGNPLCDACTHPAEECEEFREKIAQASVKKDGT